MSTTDERKQWVGLKVFSTIDVSVFTGQYYNVPNCVLENSK